MYPRPGLHFYRGTSMWPLEDIERFNVAVRGTANKKAAINFVTRTGQTCTEKRQGFILLSDRLGISRLVDAINHDNRESVAETTFLSFYVVNPPEMPLGSDVTGGMKGDP